MYGKFNIYYYINGVDQVKYTSFLYACLMLVKIFMNINTIKS